MLRLLLTRRWLGFLTLVVAVAVGCVLLSQWQWHRREQRLARNHVVESNYDRAPEPLARAVAPGSEARPLPGSRRWTPVELSGTYLPQSTVLIRNRPLDGANGYYVLVGFRDDDGRVLYVNRGWVPTGHTSERPDSLPAPPAGRVVVLARLQPPEESSGQDAPRGQAHRIVPAELAAAATWPAAAPTVVTGTWGRLAQESPTPETAPRPLPAPELDEGPHLSYSVQWVMFGLGAFVGFYFLVRRAWEDEQAERAVAAGIDPDPVAASGSPRWARRRSTRDEDEEDALLDAAGRG